MISKIIRTKIGRRGRWARRKDSRGVVELPRDFRRLRSFFSSVAVLHLLLLHLDCIWRIWRSVWKWSWKWRKTTHTEREKTRENLFLLLLLLTSFLEVEKLPPVTNTFYSLVFTLFLRGRSQNHMKSFFLFFFLFLLKRGGRSSFSKATRDPHSWRRTHHIIKHDGQNHV